MARSSSRSPERSPTAGPSNGESTHSSPRAGSVASTEQRQRDQDVHLAHSMNQSNAFVRTRSNTVMAGGDMTTPQRINSDGRAGQSSNVGGTGGRRRGSISVQPTSAMDQLADDLEIQAHQDSQQDRRYFDGENSSAAASGGGGRSDRQQARFAPMPHHTPSNVQHSAAAARLYRHHRNLSESSIDSQGGAYIDHRRQPHSLSISVNTPGRMGANIGSSRSPEGYGRAGDVRRGSQGDEPLDEFSLGRPYPIPRHSASRSPVEDLTQSGISSRTTRPFTTEDLDEHPLSDDDDNRHSPRQHLERHPSQHSYHSIASRHSAGEEDRHLSGDFQLSRQGSFTGPPEDDICYPAHGAAPEADLIDIGYGQHHDHRHHHDHPDAGVPGVLHNFPFPFDFGVLEEFAEREKEGMPIPGARKRNQRAGLSSGISPPGYGTSHVSNRAAFSSGSEGEGRRSTRQRKLSESVAPGRYRRKLALFEGAGDEDDGPSRPPPDAQGRTSFATILDTKTPLLDKRDAGPGYGSAGGRGGAAAGATGAARPYRFSFYSNALPSTIHARSLAEIPGEGQTFEELFVGKHESSYEDENSYRTGGTAQDPRMTAFSPPSGGGTGTNTPNGGASTASANGAPLNSARPAGVPQTGLGAEARARAEKARTGLIRSDVDAEANTWWLDVLCPTDAEMKVLSKVFGIHPLTTEDIQMEETREKIELFRNYYFVCFRSFEQDPYSPTYLEPLNMYIIVFREGTLSFHFRGTPHPQNVRRRIKQLKDYINVTSDWISYALIDDITDAFGPLIQNIEYEVDSIDELVLILKEAEQSDMLRRIGTCRKKVMGLLRLMGNKADVVKGLSKRCNENWSVAPKSDIGLYLSDIQDHITTSTQNLTHYEKILSRSHSNYLAQISIEMTDANNQINDVLSKLTALGTVLIPMNLVTGLFGMNVNVPGQGVENLNWFFAILGCLGAFAVAGSWLTYKVFVRS